MTNACTRMVVAAAMTTLVVAAGCHTAPKVHVPTEQGMHLQLVDARPAEDRKQNAMKNGFVLGDSDFSPTPPDFIRARLGKLPELTERAAQVTLQRFQVSVTGRKPDMNVTSKGSTSEPASAGAAGGAIGGALGGIVAAALRDADWEAGNMEGPTAYVDCELLLVVDGQPFRAKVGESGRRDQASALATTTVVQALDQVAEMIRAQRAGSRAQ
jgi:hypothetical protein